MRFNKVIRLTLVFALVISATPFVPSGEAFASRRTEVTGVLTIWVLGEGSSESHVAVVDTSSQSFRVSDRLIPANARTGDRVVVGRVGKVITDVRLLRGKVRAMRAVDDGERKVLVIITSTTTPVASPASNAAQVAAVMAEVNERFKSYSNNRISLATDIVTATVASASCDTFNENIKNASTASGVDTTPYKHVIVFLPLSGCGFAGLGSLGGGSVMLVSTGFTRTVVTHELGHNFGLEHSATMWCGDASTPKAIVADWSQACSQSEYGDAYSPMGSSGTLMPPSPQLIELGWLDQTQVAPAGASTVELSPLSAPSGTRALVLPDPSALGAYWVEYRTAVGADTSMSNPGQVQVRFLPKNPSAFYRTQTALLNTSGVWANRLTVPGMTRSGQVFMDPTGKLSVTVVSLGATAVLSVVEDPPSILPVPTGLVGEFTGNDLELKFTAPATGLRILGYSVSLTDSAGAITTYDSASSYGAYFQAVRPGPAMATVTATSRDGRKGSASLSLVSPPLPEVSFQTLTPVAGGVKIKLALSAKPESGPEYTVVASRKGHADRRVFSRTGSFSMLGLPAGGRWTLTVTAKINELDVAPITRQFTPKKGGIELGTVTRKSDGSMSAVLTVPNSRRGDGRAYTFLEWAGGAKVPRYRIPKNGKLRLRFSSEITRATISVGRLELATLILKP